MEFHTTTQKDQSILITIDHDGVVDTRIIHPVRDEDGHVDDDATSSRIEEIAQSVATKIDLGLITTDTIAMANAVPYVHALPKPVSVETKKKK